MTGRPGHRTMEMIGESSASYLACTPCVPLFCTLFNRGQSRRDFRLPGAGGDHFHCTLEPSPGHIRCQEIRNEIRARTQTFESGYFPWGRGLPRQAVGAKKLSMSLETREIKLFWRDIPGFCWDIPAVPEKFEKKKSLCSIVGHLKKSTQIGRELSPSNFSRL